MTKYRWQHRRTAPAASLLLATLGLVAPPAFSQSAFEGQRDLVRFRHDLTQFHTELKILVAQLDKSSEAGAVSNEIIAQRVTAETSRLRDQELAQIHDAFAAVPGWQSMPAELKALFPEPYLNTPASTFRRDSSFAAATPLRQAVNPATCSAGPGTANGIVDVYTARKLAIDKWQLMESLPTDALWIAARIVVSDVVGDLQRAANTAEQLNAVEAECLMAKFQANTAAALDAPVSSRATQTSVNSLASAAGSLQTSVNTMQANMAAMQNLLQASVGGVQVSVNQLQTTVNQFQANDLRMKVEENLSQSNFSPIALFMLPAAHGGHLELARTIVVDSINKMTAAGQNTFSANTRLAQADAAIAAGQFKTGYSRLADAYRELAK